MRSHCTHRWNSQVKQMQSASPVCGPRFAQSRPCTHRWNSHVKQMQSSAPVCGRDDGEPTRVVYSAGSRLPGCASPPACAARPVCAARAACASRPANSAEESVRRLRRVRGTSSSGGCSSAAATGLRERALGDGGAPAGPRRGAAAVDLSAPEWVRHLGAGTSSSGTSSSGISLLQNGFVTSSPA